MKFAHILIAIIALGTSAGLGIIMEFYGYHPVHGLFVLRAVKRLVAFLVIPGYLLMLVTGLWLTHDAWSLTFKWIQTALALWVLGALAFVRSLVLLNRQIALFEVNRHTSTSYKRVALLGRLIGGTSGLAHHSHHRLSHGCQAQLFVMIVPPNKSLQPTVIPLRGLPAAELRRWAYHGRGNHHDRPCAEVRE